MRGLFVISYQVRWNTWGIRAHGTRQGWTHHLGERSLRDQEHCTWIQALSTARAQKGMRIFSLDLDLEKLLLS